MKNIETLEKTKSKCDDLEIKLDNLTDQLLNAFDNKDIIWQNGQPEKFNNCHECGDLIKTDTILAGPHHYHEQCFNCHHCGVRLGDNFYCVNSKNYCIDHKEASLQKCSECQSGISEGGLLINDQYFHLDCFKCYKCFSILDGTYYTTDNGYLCKTDYMDTLAKCSHCSLPIKERIIRAMDTQYHPECFRCALCDISLDGVPFLNVEKSLVNCVECYKRYKAVKCVRCNEGITEANISCNGKQYHKQCYTCKVCGCSLYGQFVCCHDSEIVCLTCDSKMNNNN